MPGAVSTNPFTKLTVWFIKVATFINGWRTNPHRWWGTGIRGYELGSTEVHLHEKQTPATQAGLPRGVASASLYINTWWEWTHYLLPLLLVVHLIRSLCVGLPPPGWRLVEPARGWL